MPDHTILLIDYEPRSIGNLTRILTGAGYRVEVARDGLIGVEKFHQMKPDLVLVEAMLPKKHGFEVCETIKTSEDGRHVPVLIITAVYKGRRYRWQAKHQHGSDEYLEKPIPDERLLEVVRTFLARREAEQRPSTDTQPAAGGPEAPRDA
jgi:DNA-binding response OmpR family regulator